MKPMLATISTYNRFQLIWGAIFSILSIILTINTVQALTTQTTNTIQGHAPVLIDKNTNIIYDITRLATITLPNNTTYDINHNEDIILPKGELLFSDIKAATIANNQTVPSTSIFNNIGLKYHDWDNDDADPTSGILGDYKAVWKNNRGEVITNLNDQISICFAPYTLTISSNNVKLRSRYGDPRVTAFPDINKTYTFYYPDPPTLCYAKPSLEYGTYPHAGPSSQWNPTYGFLKQSDTDYSKNFPTTGADYLEFDLIIGNIAKPLNWQSVKQNNITAEVSNITSHTVHITLRGPDWSTKDKFIAPTQLVLQGKDNQGQSIIKYGFSLSSWYVSSTPWGAFWHKVSCDIVGGNNYRMPTIQELTNSLHPRYQPKGTSSGNYYQRAIAQGFLPEWGNLSMYTKSAFKNYPNYSAHWIPAETNSQSPASVNLKLGDINKNHWMTLISHACRNN